MTRKEKEKLVLDTLELKVGDVVKITIDASDSYSQDFKIIELDGKFILENKAITIDIGILLYHDFTKIISKKKKGELRCSNIRDCDNCPLGSLKCHTDESDTLYDILEETKKYLKMPDNIYEAYKQNLDNEVEE